MKGIRIIFILVYLIIIFFINNIYFLLTLITINLLYFIIHKICIIEYIKSFITLLPFIIITLLINFFIINLDYAILITTRFCLGYMISYAFLKSITVKEISVVIEKILSFLRIFKVDYKNIALIIYIALSIVPYILTELQQKKYYIKSKTVKITASKILIIFKSMLSSAILKVNEYEKALIAKGYND